MTIPNPQDELDGATAARLSRLGAYPVDTLALTQRLKAQLPPRPSPWRSWTRPLVAVAATLFIMAALAIGLWVPARVDAASAAMIQMHESVVAGTAHAVAVTTVEEANRLLAAHRADSAVILPTAPDAHLEACCLDPLKNKDVVTLLLDLKGVKVTLSVAKVGQMNHPACPEVTRNGRPYHIQKVAAYHMVMTEKTGMWVCAISTLPEADLLTLVEGVKF